MNNGKPITTSFPDLMKQEPTHFSWLKAGDLIEGALLERSSHRLLVDLGKYGTGIVYRGELQVSRELVRNLSVGDCVHAKVVEVDNEDGFIELSLSEAGRQKAWFEIQELKEKGEAFPVRIKAFNKGGLVTEVAGLPAFIPISQLASERYPKAVEEERPDFAKALEQLVGTELMVKLIDANPRTSKIILSEKEATEVSSRELAKNYEVGQVVEGIVSGVADFGAFVRFTDNPQVEGLIHVSELEHRMVENPKEVVKVDEVVNAKIIDIKDGKISLSLKALKEDPWLTVGERFKEGEEVRGKVYHFTPFGAVIDLGGGIQGQAHVTAFGGADEMKRELSVGKEYIFYIESVKASERRIVLKLKK